MKLKKLNKGDVIGVIAPSSPILPYAKSYKRGLDKVRDMGFNIKEGRSVKLNKWPFAGEDGIKANDIMNMFKDKNIKAVICAVGGYGANRILDKLDYKLIKNNPKPFMGISDPTALTSALFQLADIPSVYGPDICFGFGNKNNQAKKWELTLVNKILTSTEPLGKITPFTKWRVLNPGKGRGYLVGGHLGSYVGLKGTRYFADIKNKPKIFFWETTGRYAQLDEDLINLRNTDFFSNVKGMIIGKFNLMEQDAENKKIGSYIYDLINDVFKKFKFPIIADMDFGHCTPNIPLPYGKLAIVDANKNEFSILENLF